MSEDYVPSVEQLREIVRVASRFIQTIDRNYAISDQLDPDSSAGFFRPRQIPVAMHALERIFNPARLPLNDVEHSRIDLRGWDEDVLRSLRMVRNLLRTIMRAWHLEVLAEADGWVIGGDGPLLPGQVRINVPSDWPPKIERHVWQALGIETERLAEAIQEANECQTVILATNLTGPNSESSSTPDNRTIITSDGDKRYHIEGGEPVVLAYNQDVLLQAFITKPTMSKAQLIKATFEDAPRALRQLKTNYPNTLGLAITLPGVKGKGGYRVRIKASQ